MLLVLFFSTQAMDFEEKLLAAKIYALEERMPNDFQRKRLAAKFYALEKRMEDFFAMKAIPCNPQQLRPPQLQVPQF